MQIRKFQMRVRVDQSGKDGNAAEIDGFYTRAGSD
jgi:hypothetical protein